MIPETLTESIVMSRRSSFSTRMVDLARRSRSVHSKQCGPGLQRVFQMTVRPVTAILKLLGTLSSASKPSIVFAGLKLSGLHRAGPSYAMVDDMVYAVKDCFLLVPLRRATESHFHAGPCGVDGLQDGETAELKRYGLASLEWFELYAVTTAAALYPVSDPKLSYIHRICLPPINSL
ncbi:hypothetical protein F4823DRAFT_109918 [Ustulina deusta]|nr:hypothetical protein F4823DRAFT_109918 [Ustulina deusta]